MKLSERLRYLEDSSTLALAAKAKALAKAGKSVMDFTAGEPDFPTPAPLKQAAVRAIEANQTRYTAVAGIPELREAVAATLNRKRGTSYKASQVIVSCGAKHALFNVFQALCWPGDEVIVLSPYWVSFPQLVHLSGAKPVIVPTREADGFLPDPAAIERAITPATRALILNSPSNPTGAVVDETRLAAIARLAKQHDVVVVSDEIYADLVYAPAKHRSIVQADPELAERTVVIDGVSKTYSMTGWRIGYAAGPQPLIDAMIRIQSHSTSNPTSISQYAALQGLTGDQGSVETMRREFERRRDRMVDGLNQAPGCRCVMPSGAFYAWCDVGSNAAAVAAQWLDEALVAAVPGDGFGAPNWMRLSFATSMETIDEGLRRIRAWAQQRAERVQRV